MKGVVLAGGTGSRLSPLTRVTNKHLLPVYDKPMVYYPIQTLVNAGIHEILLVTGGKNAGEFLRLLGNGRDFGLKHLDYTYQEGEGGIFRRRQTRLRRFGRQHHRKQRLRCGSELSEARRGSQDTRKGSCRCAKIWSSRDPERESCRN